MGGTKMNAVQLNLFWTKQIQKEEKMQAEAAVRFAKEKERAAERAERRAIKKAAKEMEQAKKVADPMVTLNPMGCSALIHHDPRCTSGPGPFKVERKVTPAPSVAAMSAASMRKASAAASVADASAVPAAAAPGSTAAMSQGPKSVSMAPGSRAASVAATKSVASVAAKSGAPSQSQARSGVSGTSKIMARLMQLEHELDAEKTRRVQAEQEIKAMLSATAEVA